MARKEKPFRNMMKIDQNTIDEAEKLASLGLTQDQIAAFFDFSSQGWRDKRRQYPALNDAMKRGRSKRVAKVSTELMKLINSGNLGAIIFYLRTKGGWKVANPDTENPNEMDDLPDDKKLTLGTSDPVEASKVYQEFMNRG